MSLTLGLNFKVINLIDYKLGGFKDIADSILYD